jgi:hypothetical protein
MSIVNFVICANFGREEISLSDLFGLIRMVAVYFAHCHSCLRFHYSSALLYNLPGTIVVVAVVVIVVVEALAEKKSRSWKVKFQRYYTEYEL